MFNTVLDTTCLQERKKFRPKASIYGQILPDSALVGEDPTQQLRLQCQYLQVTLSVVLGFLLEK